MTVLWIGSVPVRVHWTLGAPLVVLLAAIQVRMGSAALLQAAALIAGLLGSVLLHELGHVVAAAHYGIRTRAILLLPIGGAAQLEHRWVPARVDAIVAAAGPLVSLALGGLLLAIGSYMQALDVMRLGLMNIGLGLLNLAPVFPMDGGRVLRALLVQRVGLQRGTVIALLVGLVLVIAFAAVGAWQWQPEILLLSLFLLAGQRREWAAQAA